MRVLDMQSNRSDIMVSEGETNNMNKPTKYHKIYDTYLHELGQSHDCSNILSTDINPEFVCEHCDSWMFYDDILKGGGWQCPVCIEFISNKTFFDAIREKPIL